MAYTGIESAWDEMQEHDEAAAKALFHVYHSDVSFGVNFISHVRLENRASQQPDYSGPITNILADYQACRTQTGSRSKWAFNASDDVRESILLRAAAPRFSLT